MPEIANSSSPGDSRAQASEQLERTPIRVKRLTSWEDCETLSQDWERILRNSPGLTIFSTPEWLGAWWKGFGSAKQLVVLSFSNAAGEVIGLAPLYRDASKHWRLGGVNPLRLVGDGSGDSDNLDLIFRSGEEKACSEALLTWLDSEPGWDICELNTLDADSGIARAMTSCLGKRGWPTALLKRPSSAVILPDDWDSYLRQLSREHARGIERYTRRLERHYAVRIFKCAREEELPPSLEALFELHQKRWQLLGEPGSFAVPERRQFYYEMSRRFLQRGWLEFWLLELDGKIAAAQFAFRYRDTVFQLQEGLDPEHYSDRAGVVLRGHILKQLIAQGVRRYDFLGGVDAHKRSWGAQDGNYTDIWFAKSLFPGSIHLPLRHGTRLAKEWLKPHVPYPVWRMLKRIRSRVLKGD